MIRLPALLIGLCGVVLSSALVPLARAQAPTGVPRFVFGYHTPPPGSAWTIGKYQGGSLAQVAAAAAPQIGSTKPTEVVVEGQYLYCLFQTSPWKIAKYHETNFGSAIWIRNVPQQQSTYFSEFDVKDGGIYGLHKVQGGPWRIARYQESNMALSWAVNSPLVSSTNATEIAVENGWLYALHKVASSWTFARYTATASLTPSGTWSVPQVFSTGFSEFDVFDGTVYGLHKPQGSYTVRAYQASNLAFVWSAASPQQGTTNMSDVTVGTGSFQATSSLYGSGCAGTAGTPTLTTSGSPVLGGTVTYSLSGAPPSATLLLATGWSQASVDFTSAGAPGCFGLTSQEQLAPFTAGPAGTFSLPVGVPNAPILLGSTLYAQFGVLDPGANAAGLTTSNASAATVGNY